MTDPTFSAPVDARTGYQVFVGGLDPYVQKEQLEAEFTRFGIIKTVWIAYNPPGFGFVTFHKKQDAEESCLVLDQTSLFGKKLRVEMADKSRKEGRVFERGRGRFMGGRGRGRGQFIQYNDNYHGASRGEPRYASTSRQPAHRGYGHGRDTRNGGYREREYSPRVDDGYREREYRPREGSDGSRDRAYRRERVEGYRDRDYKPAREESNRYRDKPVREESSGYRDRDYKPSRVEGSGYRDRAYKPSRDEADRYTPPRDFRTYRDHEDRDYKPRSANYKDRDGDYREAQSGDFKNRDRVSNRDTKLRDRRSSPDNRSRSREYTNGSREKVPSQRLRYDSSSRSPRNRSRSPIAMRESDRAKSWEKYWEDHK